MVLLKDLLDAHPAEDTASLTQKYDDLFDVDDINYFSGSLSLSENDSFDKAKSEFIAEQLAQGQTPLESLLLTRIRLMNM